MNKQKVAIIGGGVSGIVTAYGLENKYDVTIFEGSNYLGGHTATHVFEAEQKQIAIDTGFIVLNDQTYPTFTRFVKKLNVQIRSADMSFGFCDTEQDFAYSGRGLKNLLAQKRNLVRPKFWRLLAGIKHFSRAANSFLAQESPDQLLSLGQFFKESGVSDQVAREYVLPVGASIWSTPLDQMLNYPALSYLSFFKNHGLLAIKNRPQWQTVVGGSNQYVQSFCRSFTGKIKLNAQVEQIVSAKEGEHRRQLILKGGIKSDPFDIVVVCLHADQVLALFDQPAAKLTNAYASWKYNQNQTILHTDTALLPKNRSLWAAWNYLKTAGEQHNQQLAVSYWMNLLMGLEGLEQEYLVSLNCADLIDPKKIIAQFDYQHPLYTTESLRSQEEIAQLSGQEDLYFAGSYLGYGFHEDAVKSANRVIKKLDGDVL